MVRILFASDSHLNKHYARMTPDQLGRRRARLRAGWEATIAAAVDGGCDIYIHGGDLFDGPNPRSFEMTRAVLGFKRLREAGIIAFTLGGNHDIPRTRGGEEAPQEVLAATDLAVAFTRGLTWWTGSIRGVRVAVGGLAPDATIPADEDPLARVDIAPPAADVVVLATHHAVEGTLPEGALEPVIRLETIHSLSGRVHALLVGHVHGAVGFEVGAVQVVFPGPTERMSFGELDVRPGYAILEAQTNPAALRVTRHRLAPQPMRRFRVRAENIPAAGPNDWLADQIRAHSDPDQILQLRLEGTIDRATFHELHFHELARLGAAWNFFFDLDRHGLVVADGSAPLPITSSGRPSPAREIHRAARARMDTAGGDERGLLEEAARLALATYGGDSVVES
jgi:hypothetical protein